MPVAIINGINYSWSNASLILFGIPIIGITKISLKEKQTKENNYGAGVEPVSRGYGRKEYEGSISLYWDEVVRLIEAAPNRKLADIAPFDIPMILAGARVLPKKVVAKSCEFLETPFATNEGDTKIVVDIPLIVAGIDW